jgi:bacterioferritin-associated ferredoxin
MRHIFLTFVIFLLSTQVVVGQFGRTERRRRNENRIVREPVFVQSLKEFPAPAQSPSKAQALPPPAPATTSAVPFSSPLSSSSAASPSSSSAPSAPTQSSPDQSELTKCKATCAGNTPCESVCDAVKDNQFEKALSCMKFCVQKHTSDIASMEGCYQTCASNISAGRQLMEAEVNASTSHEVAFFLMISTFSLLFIYFE